MTLPKRKPTRLKEYDYSSPGAYFITICTAGKKHILSKIVGAIHESPENQLTEAGKIAKTIIEILPDRFHVSIPVYVIMPNHIHLIVEIHDTGRAIHESPLRKRSVIDKMVGFLKANVTKNLNSTPSAPLWQRSYHDHVIRGKKDYLKIWEYIDTNVLKWENDCFFTQSDNI